MHGPISAVLRQPAPRPPHRQHDGDAAVTHGRTPVERSAHRAPSEACPSHVVRAEQVGRGGPAGMGGCGTSARHRVGRTCSTVDRLATSPVDASRNCLRHPSRLSQPMNQTGGSNALACAPIPPPPPVRVRTFLNDLLPNGLRLNPSGTSSRATP